MATNSLGTLTLDLVAKIGSFTGPLEKAQLTTKRTTASIAESIRNVTWAYAGASAAIAGSAGVLVAFTERAAENARELQNQANQANSNVEVFQKWSYAARTTGIEQDKLSDILQDTNDKIGDFLNTGGGELQNFFQNVAPKVGVTAKQFKNLSGPQALQLYYNSLEKANLSQADMTFYMEAIANDGSRLIPLLRNNGQALSDMGDEASELGIVLSKLDVANLTEFANQYSRTTSILKSFSNLIAANVAPYLSVLNDRIVDSAKHAGNLGQKLPDALENSARSLIPLVQGFEEFREVDARFRIYMAEMQVAETKLFLDIQNWIGNTINGIAKMYNTFADFTKNVSGIELPKIDGDYFNLSGYKKYVDQAKEATDELSVAQKNLSNVQANPDKYSNALKSYIDDVHNMRLNPPEVGLPSSANTGTGGGNGVSAQQLQQQKQKQQLQQQKALAAAVSHINDLYKMRADLIGDTSTKSEKAFATAQAQYEKLATIQEQLPFAIKPNESSKISDRIFQNAFTKAPSVGSDSTMSGRQDKYKDEQKQLQDWYSTQMDLLQKFRDQRLGTIAEYEAKEADIKSQYQDKSNSIQKQQLEDQLSNFSDIYGNMADVLGTFFGKQSTLYKSAFVTSKAFAVAQALINAPKTASDAYSAMAGIPYVGPALGVAAAAAAVTSQLGFASQIQGVNLQGQAHSGLENVPSTGTYNLQKNERVLAANTSAKMDRTLARVNTNMDRGSTQTQAPNQPIYIMNGSQARRQKMSNGEMATIIDDDFEQGGPISQTMLNRMQTGRRLR